MTAADNVWTFDASVDTDPFHVGVMRMVDHTAHAVDGDVGPIVCVSAQPNRSYILVDENAVDAVIVPARSVVGHGPDGAVNLTLTTKQIAAAPRFDAERCNDREYYELLGEYFAPLLASSATVATARGRSRRRRTGRGA